jgi:predicted SprT family Zn-dependent metalloprotease
MVLPRATFLMNLSTKPGKFCEMPKIINNELYSKRNKKVGSHKGRWIDQIWMMENPRRGQHPHKAVVQMIMPHEVRDVTIHG